MNDINYLNGLIETLGMLIPNNSDSYQEIGGHRISTSNHDGSINITVEPIEQTFDDTQIKELVSNYKRNLDLLDDCIFVDVLDELATYNVNLKQFDDLLNKEELTESEETYVSYLIDFTNSLIHQHILNKITDLNELIDNF